MLLSHCRKFQAGTDHAHLNQGAERRGEMGEYAHILSKASPLYFKTILVDHAVSRKACESPATHWQRSRLAGAVCFYLLLYHHRILVGKLRENALYSPCHTIS